jgi:NAD(P)-dependent dehydrogenase (short-subunit alcohol dehydrogenase family)
MLAGFAEALLLFHNGREFHGGQELTAGPLAAPAGLGAHRHPTGDGLERTFALNHLAPFLLTNLLLDRL